MDSGSQRDYTKETNSMVAKEEGETEKLTVESDSPGSFNIFS